MRGRLFRKMLTRRLGDNCFNTVTLSLLFSQGQNILKVKHTRRVSQDTRKELAISKKLPEHRL